MRLKGTPGQAVHDLQGGAEVVWLGYRLRKGGGGLEVSLTEKAWKRLEATLELAHTKDCSSGGVRRSWRQAYKRWVRCRKLPGQV
jgi:hypothetical protein